MHCLINMSVTGFKCDWVRHDDDDDGDDVVPGFMTLHDGQQI